MYYTELIFVNSPANECWKSQAAIFGRFLSPKLSNQSEVAILIVPDFDPLFIAKARPDVDLDTRIVNQNGAQLTNMTSDTFFESDDRQVDVKE